MENAARDLHSHGHWWANVKRLIRYGEEDGDGGKSVLLENVQRRLGGLINGEQRLDMQWLANCKIKGVCKEEEEE